MQRLLGEVRRKRLEVIVVYKIDRLTRSLTDFARLAELFDAHNVSFVSITQQFNTTSSMGRLMLNVLLSFAQFEREITGERIRDKIAASKKKGLWMGGNVPLGYDAVERALVINPTEAETVRLLYRLYREHGCVASVHSEARRLALRTKVRDRGAGQIVGGQPFSRGHLYRILNSPIYAGLIGHKGTTYPGLHQAIIDPATWQSVQDQLADNALQHRTRTNAKAPALLAGLLVDAQGHKFTPSHSVKHKRRYRYYIDRALITGDGPTATPIRRIPAPEIEGLVIDGIADLLSTPPRLLGLLADEKIRAAEINRVIGAARQLQKNLRQAEPTTAARILAPLLHKVVLAEALVLIYVSKTQLRTALALRPDTSKADASDICVLKIPARVRTRGVQLKIVMENPAGAVQRNPDPALIKALGRAFDWLQSVKAGQVSSVSEIAVAENLTGSYVTRVLRLAFLAPNIVEAIITGTQPVELTLDRILRGGTLPLTWPEQRRHLGFPTG
jgi:DNA invertase Pin-like site-specific DNA recombinase